MTRSALLALLALCVAGAAANDGESALHGTEGPEVPPQYFPTNKAEPFSGDKLRFANVSLEAADMNKNITVDRKETIVVDHPHVKDPGTTHEEDESDSRGTIQACELPDPGSATSASDWLADSGHVSKLAKICKLPSALLNGTSGTLRICSIPKDVWDSAGNNFTSGTVPKQLLDKLNELNVTCVTPRSNNSAIGNGTITSGSIPSASLWGRNNTIYIYIIPREWLQQGKTSSGKATEVEDLTSEPVHEESNGTSVVGFSSSTQASTSSESDVTPTPLPPIAPQSSPNATATAAGAANVPAQGSSNITEPSIAVKTNDPVPSTALPTNTSGAGVDNTVASSTTQTTARTPIPSKELSNVIETGNTPTKKPIDVKTTDRPKEETTKPEDKVSAQTKKPFDKTVGTTTSTVAPVSTKELPTEGPVSSTTGKSKEQQQPHYHSDAENEIEHNAPSPAPLSQSHNDHNPKAESSGKTGFLQPTESAAILAGVFVAIAVLGYAGLLLWRRVLEKRYGNREMLVNEEDDFDTSDMRHFEL